MSGGRGPSATPGPWRRARPELAIAAVLLVAAAGAGYALAGGPAAALVAVIFAVAALLVTDRLVPVAPAPPVVAPGAERRAAGVSFINYWRARTSLTDAGASVAAYYSHLGPQLEHLLAARLAEHHGVSLFNQREAAREILCPGGRDADLWLWVDPARPAAGQPDAPGIPLKALARLVRRLEEL